MVQLILDDIGIELGQLVVHLNSTRIILHIEMAVSEEGKSSAVSRRELKLVGKDSDDLSILLVANQRVDCLCVLAVRYGSEVCLHV